jgi:hypothetical protein
MARTAALRLADDSDPIERLSTADPAGTDVVIRDAQAQDYDDVPHQPQPPAAADAPPSMAVAGAGVAKAALDRTMALASTRLQDLATNSMRLSDAIVRRGKFLQGEIDAFTSLVDRSAEWTAGAEEKVDELSGLLARPTP